MSAFLDYASTNPYPKYRCCDYGPFMNVNANYAYKEKRLIRECEERVKVAIGAKGGKVVFGGTSSQLIENLMGAIGYERLGYEAVCSHYEHDSFYRYRDRDIFNLSDLKFELDTADDNIKSIVIWQAVQNITGEIFPVKQIGELVHKYNGFYICDGTAQLGHTPIEPNIDDWCDFWCCSGHKIGTELGIGCCWVSDRLDKWLNGLKLHGTPNLAGALVLTQAVEDACDKDTIAKRNEHWLYLFKGLGLSLLDNGIRWVGIDRREWETGTWAINAIHLPGFNADALQQYLASKQIYIGVGHSSCSDNSDFRILEAYGLTKEEASEVIRISFGEDSSVEEVETLVDNIVSFKKEYVND